MIGEFSSKIILLHTIIIGVVFGIMLIIFAFKKPEWYKYMQRLLIAIIVILTFYKMGWQDALKYHEVPYVQQTRFSHGLLLLFYLLLLLDIVWLRHVHKHTLQDEHTEA